MGWSTFKERIIKERLGFVKRIKGMNVERWAKRELEEGRRDPSLKKRNRQMEYAGEPW